MIPGRIGTGITTKNRHEVLKAALGNHFKYGPRHGQLVVVDDGSETPVAEVLPSSGLPTVYRNQTSHGIAAAKNRCLQVLMDLGCEHIFLFDDDAWPIDYEWYYPYLMAGQPPHLMAMFAEAADGSPPLAEVYRDEKVVAFHASRGYMLYYHRSVIEKVGGFDPRFQFGYEHVEHSLRIHNAGFTLFPFMDQAVTGGPVVYALDSDNKVESTMSNIERRGNTERNLRLLDECEGRTTYVPYQVPRKVILTCLFTKHPDPQRGTKWNPDTSLLASLIKTTGPHPLVIFHDEIAEDQLFLLTDNLAYVKEDSTLENPYIQRWISYRRYLIAHPEISHLWCVDGTDVELRLDPWIAMAEDTIYCGWENATVGSEWMRFHHGASLTWIRANENLPLLNAGVVGGTRGVVLTLTAEILRLYADQVRKGEIDERGDMAMFNRAVRRLFDLGRLVTGPPITTLFKGFEPPERNNWSIWCHK